MRKVSPFILLALLSLNSCITDKLIRKGPAEEAPVGGQTFDPLATVADREVVPEVYAAKADDIGRAGDSLIKLSDSLSRKAGADSAATCPAEVYRVQIFTSRLYVEANRELMLAKEIFNLPVHLDYEVPYYKLRVGDFATRQEAESIVPDITAMGYSNPWVARVVVHVQEAPAYDLSEEPTGLTDGQVLPQDTSKVSAGGDNR